MYTFSNTNYLNKNCNYQNNPHMIRIVIAISLTFYGVIAFGQNGGSFGLNQSDSESAGQGLVKKDTVMENMLLDKISRLKEVKALNQLNADLPDGSHSPVGVSIEERPSAGAPYYFVRAGYNEIAAFRTIYKFRIEPQFISKKKIDNYLYIFDLSNDYFVPLTQWRKYQKQHKR
jgi:hypothetical protein